MMRPIFSVVLLCAACGDNLIVDQEEGPPVDEPGFEEVEARFVPDVCSVRSWPTVAFPDRDVDLTVVPTPTGAAIFTVAQGGGPVRGFAIDNRGLLETKEQGNIIRDDMTFMSVSAAFIDERIITAAVSDTGIIAVDMVRPDLDATFNLVSARGNMVADVPIAHLRDQRFATVGDDKGVTGFRFDSAWAAAGSQIVGGIVPKTMTATRYRDDTMVVWSTDTTCHLTRVAAERTSSRPFPCLAGRIAVNTPERSGRMVYEEGADKLMISEIRVGGESEIANTRLFVQPARAPKIVFDGVRYWVSYLNARNDVVVGHLEADGTLVSMALEGTQPYAEGYELAVLNGAVWVVAVDGAGANAQRLCLKPIR